jgi:hypothetical protein
MNSQSELAVNVVLEGGCLCGAISYQIAAMPFDADHCHCRQCQLSTGAVVASWMDVKVSELTWVKGNEVIKACGGHEAEKPALPAALKEFASSANVRRGFCMHCGTSLTFRDIGYPDFISLSISSLGDPNLVPVNYHIYTQSQVSWLKIDDNTVRYPAARTANI